MVGPPQPSLALRASRRCSSFRGSAMYFVPAMSSQIPRTSCRKRCTSAGGGGLLRLSIYATRIALFISWSILLLSAIKSLIPPEVPKAFSAACRNSLSKGYSTVSVTACSICGYEVKCCFLHLAFCLEQLYASKMIMRTGRESEEHPDPCPGQTDCRYAAGPLREPERATENAAPRRLAVPQKCGGDDYASRPVARPARAIQCGWHRDHRPAYTPGISAPGTR